ncbi:MAG: glycosyltransferase family 2 protein [Candidatus Bathyarchaeia archaeon]
MNTAKKVSIFIPVYKESSFLEQILTSLLNDPYNEKEIFVVIDEPTQKSLEIVKKFSSKGIYFNIGSVRRGKVSALNEAIKESSGDIFLFLDADVLISDLGKSFLESIVKEMEDAELIEIRKEVIRDSFIAKIVGYDYLGFTLTNLYFSRKIGQCLAINGAAFAIKRETFEALGGFKRTVCEDLDIAIRSFANGARFKFINNPVVLTKAPSSLREWLNQRKRWAIGAALWIKDNFKTLKRALRKYPRVIVLSILSSFPSIPLPLIGLFIPDEPFINTLYMLLLSFSLTKSILIFPTTMIFMLIPAIKSLITLLGGFLAYSIVLYVVARRIRFHFSLLEFMIFYFVMTPLWLILIVFHLFKVLIKRSCNLNIDWKV